MAELINLAGTASHSFSIGQDGVTTYYGTYVPPMELGRIGDTFIQTKIELEDEHGEQTGETEDFGRVYHKMMVDDVPTWVILKNYTFDSPIINENETEEDTNNYRISLQNAKGTYKDEHDQTHTPDSTTSQGSDYGTNHDFFGVTRYATNTEAVADDIANYQTWSSTSLPTNFDKNTNSHKFEDKFVSMTPEQIGKNIKVEMKRAISVEGTLNSLTTRTKVNLVSAINELDGDLGTVASAMTTGTALGGKTISTGNNTDVSAATAISTLNTKAGVLTSLTTDEKNTLVGAINEVDSHADTNKANIGSVTTAMATGTALAGKTIATGNNTDITVANAISTLNTAVKTNKDNIGNLNSLTTTDKSNLVAAVNSEVTRATNAEGDLQDQIDAITSKSDVADVVSCYNRGSDTSKTDIAHYDTTPLYDNDVIKVLIDETHDNATTYYRWNWTDPSDHSRGGAWSYIGPEGSYYTKGEADSRFVNVDGDTMTGTLTISSTGSIDAASATSVTVPTKAAGTNTTDAASTAFVGTAIANEDALVVHLSGNETIAGTKTFSTTPVVGTLAENNNSTSAASTAYVTRAIATEDSKVVHITGDETVAGTKTFTSRPSISKTFATTSRDERIKNIWSNAKLANNESLPSDSIFAGFSSLDANDFEYSSVYSSILSNGTTQTALWVNHPNGSSSEIGIKQTAAGVVSTFAPTPTATNSTADTNIATTGWVNDSSKSTNVVHRTGNETITGTKTMTSATVHVATQARGNSTTLAASTAFVADGLSLKVDKSSLPSITSGTNGQVLSNNGSAFVWKTVRDITTLGGLDDTAVDNEQDDQSLVFDSTIGEEGAWVNKRPMIATISYW